VHNGEYGADMLAKKKLDNVSFGDVAALPARYSCTNAILAQLAFQ